jgi:AraC-like DNA-binding protein
MYDLIRQDMLFIMLYAIVMVIAALACVYLLFRRGNAFAPDVIPPRRLRRWTAAFFGVLALGHVWYMPAALINNSEDVMLCMLIGALLDCLVVIPLAIFVMFCMLQDKQRPLWPIGIAVAPLIVGALVCIITQSDTLVPWLRLYFLPLGAGLAIYMFREVRQYGRWLRDNYADLEHKEVWQSFVAMASILLLLGYYVSGDSGMVYEYIVQLSCIVLVFYLLWRVETLSSPNSLKSLTPDPSPKGEGSGHFCRSILTDKLITPLAFRRGVGGEAFEAVGADFDDINQLLRERCVEAKFYLQHDLTAVQLAQDLGTNRTYLSQYFSAQGTTYNAYINKLRIDYFVKLYTEAEASGQNISAKQLAARSGYRSYSTFSLAFKQRMGQSVTSWMNKMGHLD